MSMIFIQVVFIIIIIAVVVVYQMNEMMCSFYFNCRNSEHVGPEDNANVSLHWQKTLYS